VQWLRDGLGAIDAAADSEALALSVPDNNDVYFVPALVGLGAPHWAPEATGLITGLRRDSTQAHIVRAALEAQAYQTYDLIKAMEADSGYWPEAIRVDGGLVANGFVCQFLADILDMRVEVPAVSECTAWGAAALAGVQLGVFKNLDQLVTAQQDVSIYTPAMESKTRDALIAGWQKAVKKTLS